MSNSRLILPILVPAASLGLLASSIYVPSIPDIARELAVPVGLVQLTMTVFLASYGVAMLVIGPLSDRFGRRRVMLTGILLCLVASLVCAAAPGIVTLIVGRAFQAFGGCAGVVIARAMVRDLFDREQVARAMAIVASAVTIVPIAGPVLGGYVHVWLGWRANFVIVALGGLALFAIVALRMPETNLNLQNQATLFRGLVSSFATLLRARRFLAYALVTGCGGAAYYAFAAAAPVVFIERFHVSPDVYGIYAASASGGFMFGSVASSRFSVRLGADWFIRLGGWVQIGAGAAMIGLAAAGYATPWAVVPPIFLMGVANGLYMPNAFAGGVSIQPHLAGAAAGLAGFVQMFGAGLATAVMASSALETAIPMGLVIAGAGLLITVAFRILLRG
ncbi:MAG TPA: multidrug effflux MFS transporter [Alphaproteobacteria bacterium]|nr:multidrug effflux MFS transporter [Alphaproteobacteria bacterium]